MPPRLPRSARVRTAADVFDEALWRKVITPFAAPRSRPETAKEGTTPRKEGEEERNWANDLLKNNFGF